MYIKKIKIENYKSIKIIEFSPNKGLNALIGANSTGKSNIFNAINLLLGHIYPSFNSIHQEDHFLGNENNYIKINLEFNDNHSLEFNEHKRIINFKGESEIKSGLFYDDNDYSCKKELRDKYCSAYLGIDRKILDYLPSNKWSLIGRILQEINKKFLDEQYTYKNKTKFKKEWLIEWLNFIRDNLLFSVKDTTGNEMMKKLLDIIQEESAKQLNKPKSDFKVDLSLYDPWNFYKTLQLLVKEEDMELEFQASNLGMGVQASISIAILKAYSELNLANKSPIFIDEPELFLHPHAQRNFYKILRELSEDKYDDDGNIIREGTQVFYTTHSPNFLSAGNFNEIFLVRKNKKEGTYINFGNIKNFIKDLENRTTIKTDEKSLLLFYKNAYENTGDTQKANEGFFAKKIILVEGQSESLIIPFFFDLIKFDYIKEGISIVCCGNKCEIDRFFRLYNEFGIPCYTIFDGDKNLEGTSDEKENIKRNKAILSIFNVDKDYPDNSVYDRYLGFEYYLEKNLGYSTSKKGLQLFLEVKKKVENKEINIPDWINEVKEKIINLSEENTKSILDLK